MKGRNKKMKITKEQLKAHKGHKINIVTYGNPAQNISLECESCNEVIIDFDI